LNLQDKIFLGKWGWFVKKSVLKKTDTLKDMPGFPYFMVSKNVLNITKGISMGTAAKEAVIVSE
jgi:hypothetical protein